MDGKQVGPGHKNIPRPTDFYTEVEKGRVPGHSIVHKFGHGVVGTTLAPLTISGVYQVPTVATSLEFVSSDVNDTFLGSGARTIQFTGIDENWNETVFTIETNGTTAVPLPTDLLRLYTWDVLTSGTYATGLAGSHVGALTVRAAEAGATWSIIENAPFPAGRSEIGAYTVPNGVRAYIIQQELHGDSVKSVDVFLFKRTGADIIVAPFSPMTTLSHWVGISGINATDFKAPVDGLPAKTDIGYMGLISNGTGNISVHFSILLIADGY
jgi:hypothetical protein